MRLMHKTLAALCLLSLLFPIMASAQIPYDTFFVDSRHGRMSVIQPIYVPKKIIDGNRMDMPLSSPSDLFIAPDGKVYIVDTNNNRIVELDAEGNFLRSIGDAEGSGRLNRPEGVFVDEDGMIYVANTGDRTVVTFGSDGNPISVYGKPESNLLYDDYFFQPSKLVVDRRGIMYIVVKDTYQGLFRMNQAGEFTGFFGANKAKLTYLDRLKRMILSREQLEREVAIRPNAVANVTISDDGFLFVTSSGNKSDGQIRKLNAGGVDAFQNLKYDENLVDLAVDSQGFLYTISRRFGEVGIYDPTGTPMIYFGMGSTTARQQGVVSYPTSIAVSGTNEVWVVDGAQNVVHVFERTSFGETFLKANELFFKGEYEASKPHWEEVAAQNGMMDIAFTGLGKHAFYEGDYDTALALFLEARDPDGYSDAFWYVRYEWIRRYFSWVFFGAIFAIWGVYLLLRRRKFVLSGRTWHPLLMRTGSELRDAIYVMFHPYDGFYRLKERRISWFAVIFIVAAAVAVNLYSIFGSSIIVYPYNLAWVNIPLSIGTLLVPWITWALANYLVSTVKGGEGRFREVVQGSTFAMVPYIVLMVPATWLSNLIVTEEWVVYDLLTQVMWVWIAFLFFVMTQVTHNFDFGETIKNIVITAFTIAIIWIFLAIIIALSINLYDFLIQIYREVTLVA